MKGQASKSKYLCLEENKFFLKQFFKPKENARMFSDLRAVVVHEAFPYANANLKLGFGLPGAAGPAPQPSL